MKWFDVEINYDGDSLRSYAIEAENEAQAREIALAQLPEPDVTITPLPDTSPDPYEPAYDEVIAYSQ